MQDAHVFNFDFKEFSMVVFTCPAHQQSWGFGFFTVYQHLLFSFLCLVFEVVCILVGIR